LRLRKRKSAGLRASRRSRCCAKVSPKKSAKRARFHRSQL
jgi:hypothetical protein